ncbi:hypothetical protein I5Q34_27090 [Streptomyces sp. AV19]|uniref:hypothetical protein n=1 Tax=Streptomyces sp. AV19 TaxID=2793068 RepID=UPI0018FE66D2|nr:hypothetical protein [Streptomyces sp. AV19]MBH1937891.1 hypothetical protein [Streptomyces sp. AV19]MDG4536510.1 hypothetical protein [Streptomyces sp. AV19]
MMRLVRPVLAALAGLALVLTCPLEASAAKGPFTFQTGGRPFFVQDPPDGKCFSMSQAARGPHNGTGSPATVFSGKQCKGKATRIASGQQGPKDLSFSSVRFG